MELYDFGVSADGALFYVMELLDGMDVQTLVERYGPLSSERVIYLLVQACDSLDEAHDRGLIHRDIKPANLFVARKGTVYDFLKVLDFGLVKRWSADDDADLLQSVGSVGVGETKHTAESVERELDQLKQRHPWTMIDAAAWWSEWRKGHPSTLTIASRSSAPSMLNQLRQPQPRAESPLPSRLFVPGKCAHTVRGPL